VSKAFAFQPIPKCDPQYRCRVGVYGFSGAINILSTDFLSPIGLQIAKFSEETMDKLMSVFSDRGKASNPIDSYPERDRVGAEHMLKVVLRAMLADDQIDAIFLTFYSAGDMNFQPEYLLNALGDRKNTKKPILVSILGEKSNVEVCRFHLEDRKIPTYPFPVQALKVLAKMAAYSRYRTRLEKDRVEN